MANLNYQELEIKPYFKIEGLKVEEVRNIFKFRTRMAPFGENFRGNKDYIMCPLCKEEKDNQAHCFKCPAMRKELEISCDVSEVFTDTVSLETAQTLSKMLEIRNKLLETNKKKENQMVGK